MLKILFGFEDSKLAVNNILGKLKSLGIPYEVTKKFSKATIKDFLHNHPDYSVVILKETVGETKYTAEELAELADERELNIIVVLGSEHKGQPYMQTLYSAGIVNAIFQEGRTGGGTVAGIVQLILQKRSRKEARAYYGIETVELGTLSNDMFAYYYHMLEDREYGVYLIERYLFVASKLSPLQNADFLRRLPKEFIGELSNYQEFHQVLSAIKGVGVDIAKELKIKKPKKFIDIQILPYGSPAIGVKDNYITEEQVSDEDIDSYDGYDDSDSGAFDFGFGELLAQREQDETAESVMYMSMEQSEGVVSENRELPGEENQGMGVVPSVEYEQGGIKPIKKPKRVKRDKQIKEKRVKNRDISLVNNTSEIEHSTETVGSKGAQKKSLRWLIWAIPLALILLITIVLITILIIYYVRY